MEPAADPAPTPPAATPPTPAQDAASAYSRYRRLLPWAVGVSVATLAGLSVWYQVHRGDDVVGNLRTVRLWAIPAALGLHLLMQAFWALRIRTLGRGLGAPVTFPRALALVTSGLFAAAVTPGRIGGEPWRIAMLMRGGASGAASSRTILADRAVDILYFLALGSAAVLLLPWLFGGDADRVQALGWLAVAGLAALLLLIALILAQPAPLARLGSAVANLPRRMRGKDRVDHAPRIEAFFRDVTDGLRTLLRERPGRFVAGAALSVALWTCELSILWVVLRGFGFDVAYAAVYLAGILVVMVASVPALPGGSGLAELAALTLLTPLAPGLTPAFLVVWRGLTYYMDLLVGGVVATALMRKIRATPGTPASA